MPAEPHKPIGSVRAATAWHLRHNNPLGPARRGEAGHGGTAATPARGGATAGQGPRPKHCRPRAIAPARPTPGCGPAPIRLICYEPRWLDRLSPSSGWGHGCGWLRLFVGAHVTDGWPSCAGDCTSLGDTDRPVRCRGPARPGCRRLCWGLHAALFVASCGVVTLVGPSLNNDCA